MFGSRTNRCCRREGVGKPWRGARTATTRTKRTSESGTYSESGLPSSSFSSSSTPLLSSISSCLRLAVALPLPLNAAEICLAA